MINTEEGHITNIQFQ